MLFRDVLHEQLDEFNGWDRLFNISVVFMTVVMERDSIFFFVIRVNTACCNDRTAKIAADVFGNCFGVSQGRFGIDIEAAFRDQAMDMGIPFKRSAEGVEDADKSRSEILRLIDLSKHEKNDRLNSAEQALFTEKTQNYAIFFTNRVYFILRNKEKLSMTES